MLNPALSFPVSKRLHKPLSVLATLAIFVFLYSYASIYNGFSFFNVVTTRKPVLGDLTDLVNVFIGTTGDGHVFPGATLPHGMVKAGMDTDSPDNVSCPSSFI